MVEQAVVAEKLGYRGVAVPEHHLINITMVPSPLQMAVKIACLTRRIEITTAVVVLPIRDMRVFAGEVAQAFLMTDERLILGVGRGAYPYETSRLGVPLEQTRQVFDESLEVLEALLTRKEVSWNSERYRFDSMTVMPRPSRPVPITMAASTAEALYHVARRGYNAMTTPLAADHAHLVRQVDMFKTGRAEAGPKAAGNRLGLQRGVFLARDQADVDRMVKLAYGYYQRFDNIKGPGVVRDGLIEPLPRKQTLDELRGNLLICTASEMIDRLSVYDEVGIDELIMTCGYGQTHAETVDMMHALAADVLPHLPSARRAKAA
jgi:alkanesulfonate monooxygenase SsuD/methylene tetrahydromethanopterin reductase-like flavin-dependent oxidoreductase (luciferase family)